MENLPSWTFFPTYFYDRVFIYANYITLPSPPATFYIHFKPILKWRQLASSQMQEVMEITFINFYSEAKKNSVSDCDFYDKLIDKLCTILPLWRSAQYEFSCCPKMLIIIIIWCRMLSVLLEAFLSSYSYSRFESFGLDLSLLGLDDIIFTCKLLSSTRRFKLWVCGWNP